MCLWGQPCPHPGWESGRASSTFSLLHPSSSSQLLVGYDEERRGCLQGATQATASWICLFCAGLSEWSAGPCSLLSSLPEPAPSQTGQWQDRAKANLFHTQSLCLHTPVGSPLTWAFTGAA